MIQRVQSVYLLLVTILMSLLLVFHYASVELPNNQSLLFKAGNISLISATDEVSVYKSTLPVILMVLIAGLLSFCNIFFYNNRKLQIRLNIFNLLFVLILIAFMLFYCIDARSDFEGGKLIFKIPIVIPVLCLIFIFLAIRAIRHDEKLVSSYNRIR